MEETFKFDFFNEKFLNKNHIIDSFYICLVKRKIIDENIVWFANDNYIWGEVCSNILEKEYSKLKYEQREKKLKRILDENKT